MAVKTATYQIPEYLACYFTYGDDVGMNEIDRERVEAFEADMAKRHGSYDLLTTDEESRDFVRYHDLQSYGWPTDSCVNMTFAVDRGEDN